MTHTHAFKLRAIFVLGGSSSQTAARVDYGRRDVVRASLSILVAARLHPDPARVPAGHPTGIYMYIDIDI